GLLDVVDRERHEVGAGARFLGAADGDEEDRVAAGHEHAAVGLLGDTTRLQGDDLVPDFDGFSDDVHERLRSSPPAAPNGSSSREAVPRSGPVSWRRERGSTLGSKPRITSRTRIEERTIHDPAQP